MKSPETGGRSTSWKWMSPWGSMPGTGGSKGAAYLYQTISKPLFPDLWAIRSALHSR